MTEAVLIMDDQTEISTVRDEFCFLSLAKNDIKHDELSFRITEWRLFYDCRRVKVSIN